MSASKITLPITLEPGAQAPTYQTEDAAGMDICAFEPVELAPLQRKLVRTGVRVAIPKGFEGQVRPRSGLALKFGLTMVNTPGTIDADYRGEVGIIMINLGQDVVKLERGERIAQLVVCPVTRAEVAIATKLDETQRGDGGFGSTGTQ